MWAAVWLFRATKDPQYLQYLVTKDADLQGSTQVATEFSWDLKFAGAQVLLASVGAPHRTCPAARATASRVLSFYCYPAAILPSRCGCRCPAAGLQGGGFPLFQGCSAVHACKGALFTARQVNADMGIRGHTVTASALRCAPQLQLRGATPTTATFQGLLAAYKQNAEAYLCANLPNNPLQQVYISPGTPPAAHSFSRHVVHLL